MLRRYYLVCLSCSNVFFAGNPAVAFCNDCEVGWDELDAIESGEAIVEYTQDGEGDGIIVIYPEDVGL